MSSARLFQRSLQLRRLVNYGSKRQFAEEKLQPPPPHILQKQAQYQQDASTPIHLKGGLFDNVLYKFTLILCVTGVGFHFYNVLSMAGKKH